MNATRKLIAASPAAPVPLPKKKLSGPPALQLRRVRPGPARVQVLSGESSPRGSGHLIPKNASLATASHWASFIAHELRQPLSAIQTLASYLKGAISPADSPLLLSLEMLEAEAALAGRILSNLVSFARSGKPRKRAADLHEILEQVVARICLRAEIRLLRRFGRRLPRVSADPLHVDRILANLIANSLESMEGPGTLRITTRREGANVLVQICDTGCGIHPEDAERIFQPFSTTKRAGTGLGLALSRELAEANRGTIVFSSRRGKGTTFELRLPRA